MHSYISLSQYLGESVAEQQDSPLPPYAKSAACPNRCCWWCRTRLSTQFQSTPSAGELHGILHPTDNASAKAQRVRGSQWRHVRQTDQDRASRGILKCCEEAAAIVLENWSGLRSMQGECDHFLDRQRLNQKANCLFQIRKIRCDGLPGGCSPCLQNNTECRTTDRITGRATSRGYVEGLEQQNRDLQLRVQELEQRMARNSGDLKAPNGYQNANYEYTQALSSVQRPTYSPTSEYPQSKDAQHQETNMFRALPTFRAGCTGDNYLGVSPGNSNLSSIKGTALSVLGMEIDIADFHSLDMDEPDPSVFHPQLYNKSYQAFLQSALNINPRIANVELPSRSEGLMYAEWYFRVINPFLPLLHKRSFIKLASQSYI